MREKKMNKKIKETGVDEEWRGDRKGTRAKINCVVNDGPGWEGNRKGGVVCLLLCLAEQLSMGKEQKGECRRGKRDTVSCKALCSFLASSLVSVRLCLLPWLLRCFLPLSCVCVYFCCGVLDK